MATSQNVILNIYFIQSEWTFPDNWAMSLVQQQLEALKAME